MTCKLQFGDPKAIRLLKLGELLKGVKPVKMMTPENDDDPYILQCPKCNSEDLQLGSFGEDDDLNALSTCNHCGQVMADEYLIDEYKQLKREFKQ